MIIYNKLIYILLNLCLIYISLFILGCSQYTIIPARYAYRLKTDLDDDAACLLERKKENPL